MFDPFYIAQAISRINVGYRNHHVKITVPNTSLIFDLLTILKRKGLINSFITNFSNQKFTVILNANSSTSKKFPTLSLVSTPGRRHYIKYRTIQKKYIGVPLLIISSTRGLINIDPLGDHDIGGELVLILGSKPNPRET